MSAPHRALLAAVAAFLLVVGARMALAPYPWAMAAGLALLAGGLVTAAAVGMVDR